MGRRGRKSPKKRQQSPSNDFNASGSVVRVTEKPSILEDDEIELCTLQEHKEEMGNALSSIYKEYLADFDKWKTKRMRKKISVEQTPNYKLTVDDNYRRQLARKIQFIHRYDGSLECYHILQMNIYQFVKSLKTRLMQDFQEGESQIPLKVALVCDAYSTVRNASREVGKIVYFMYARKKGDRVLACEKKNKSVFRTLVLDDPEIQQYLEVFKVRDKITKVKLFQSVMRMEKDMPETELEVYNPDVYQEEDYGSDVSWQSECDSDENMQEMPMDPVQEMSVDELCQYINGGEQQTPTKASKKNRRKRKKGAVSPNASTCSSPEKPNMAFNKLTQSAAELDPLPQEENLDAFVEEFRQRLESAERSPQRLKPNVTEEWVRSLRQRLSAISPPRI